MAKLEAIKRSLGRGVEHAKAMTEMTLGIGEAAARRAVGNENPSKMGMRAMNRVMRMQALDRSLKGKK